MKTTRSFKRLGRSAAAISASLVLLTSACGGGGDDGDAAPETSAPTVPAEQPAAEPVTDDADSDRQREISPPVFLLEEEPTVPSGFQPVAARCDAENDRGTPLAFAVPEGWNLTGAGTAGSGAGFDSKYTLNFSTPDGGVNIEVDTDRRDADGTILGLEREPWESFDYEWSSYGDEGEKSGTITFDSLDTIELADQEVEIFVAHRDQEPDFLSATEHRVRIEVAQIPNIGLDGELSPLSVVVSIAHDPEKVTLSAEDVASIVGSFTIPTCTRARELAELERTFGEDLDGDGHVSTIEDVLGRDLPDIEELLGED